MPLSDVLHQDVAVDRLRRALESRRVPHAYLFTGPAGVGKEMLATRLAQLLLCTGRTTEDAGGLFAPKATVSEGCDDACGKCEDCILFAAGNHPDFHRIHRALNKLHPDKGVQRRKAIDLGIDVIRHFLLDRIALSPSRGYAKVFLISDADRLSMQAQNALLKTLEEPPGHSYLMLLASAADELLPTTRSRCQQVAFGPLPDEFIREQLAARQVTGEAAAFISQLAQGSLGAALRFAGMKLFDRAGEVVAAVELAADDPLAAGKALADLAKELASDADREEDEEADTSAAREGQKLVIAMVSMILRDVARVRAGSAAAALPESAAIGRLASGTTSGAVGEAIRAMGLAEYQIDMNANTGLVFDGIGIAIGEGLAGAVARR